MKRLPFQKILALSPHTDDIEFGCGATLARLQEEGAEIYTAVFSSCKKSVPNDLPKDILIQEMHQSVDLLDIPRKNRNLFDYPVREFPKFRQEILENLVELRKILDPDLVLAPSRH